MARIHTVLGSLLLACAALNAQAQPATVQASGSATIRVAPDQASLNIGVVTQGATAQAAAQQNATQAAAVIAALNSLVGGTGTVQTIAYSVSPRYSHTTGQAVIIGYTASNTVQVITANLALAGQIIDAANQAGANDISGVAFSRRDPEPETLQALGQAAKQALAHAGAIAAGLGAKVGSVLSAQEGSTVIPYRGDSLGAAATTTPIQTGTVSISAYVTVTVQLLQ